MVQNYIETAKWLISWEFQKPCPNLMPIIASKQKNSKEEKKKPIKPTHTLHWYLQQTGDEDQFGVMCSKAINHRLTFKRCLLFGGFIYEDNTIREQEKNQELALLLNSLFYYFISRVLDFKNRMYLEI